MLLSLLILMLCATPPAFAQGGAGGALGSLSFSPAAPEPGDTVRVVYTPADDLADERQLDLRGRLSTGVTDAGYVESYSRTLVRLDPDGSGVFRGRLVFPDSVVLAVFAVASTSGDRVDTNARQGWVLYAHGPEGDPLRAALEAHVAEVGGYDSRTAVDVARRLAAAYPYDPSAWGPISHHSAQNPDGVGVPVDTLVARMVAFDRSLRAAGSPDPDRVHGLRRVARSLGTVGGGPVLSYWDGWVLDHAPTHPETAALRTFQAYLDHSADPAAQLDAYEEIWAEAGPGGQLTELGFSAALESDDPDAARTWAERFVADRPTASTRERVAHGLASLPETRAEGIRGLRTAAQRTLSTSPDRRDVFKTVADHQASIEDDAAWTQLDLGQALLHAGDAEAAVAPLREASAVKSLPTAFDLLSRAHLATGDTLAAARALAFVAAVGGGEPEADGRLVSDDLWTGFVESARSELVARAVRDAGDDALPEDVRLVTAGGEPVTLDALVEGAPALVALHSRSCGFCVRDMPRLDELRQSLGADGVRVVVVTRDDRSPAVAASFRERGYTGPLHFDTADGVASAFQTDLVPQYFLIDADGIVRFPFTTLDRVPAQVGALLTLASDGR